MQGFLLESELLSKAPPSLVPKCDACKLYTKCNSPKTPVDGRGKKKILVVGEGNGRNEDRHGKPFVGESGRFLTEHLGKFGIDFREDCWITNAIICRASDSSGNNRTPTPKEVEYCRPNIIKTIQDLKPEKILLFGSVAVESVIGWVWKDCKREIEKWLNWTIPCQKLNSWICCNWHPSYVNRKEDKNFELKEKLFDKYLKNALSLKGRPFEEVPNYEKQVKCIIDPDEAVEYIDKFDGVVAFDYETNKLKADAKDSEIICCSISDGTTTIAYPWVKATKEATGRLLKNKEVGKVGFNIKFEQRFTKRMFGFGVRGWKWCGMTAAHILDNREGICGLKFQSFVLLGQPSYNEEVEQFLKPKDKSRGSNSTNQISEISLSQLLLYCGLDSLLEYLVAMKQMSQMGVSV